MEWVARLASARSGVCTRSLAKQESRVARSGDPLPGFSTGDSHRWATLTSCDSWRECGDVICGPISGKLNELRPDVSLV